jgi:hypothetical protein
MKTAPMLAALVLGFLSAGPSALAQSAETAIPVTVCELQSNPLQFEGKLVHVRGTVTRGFEDFTISDPSAPSLSQRCGNSIWLEPGGDGKGPRPYLVVHSWWPADDMRDWAQQARVDSVKLIKDQQYRDMDNRLSAFRSREPDGGACAGLWICSLYTVTSTITGRFYAAHEEKLADGRPYFKGYGHMGCCHLLIIQQVTELVAEKTPVPEGGEFSCSTQNWEPTAEEASNLAAGQPCSDWGCKERQYFIKVAAHWGDQVDITKGWGEFGSQHDWISPDLMLRYTTLHEEPRKKKHAGSSNPAGSIRIDRTECKSVSPKSEPPAKSQE